MLKSQKRVGHAMEIMSTKEFCLAKVGTFPGHKTRILWRKNGSMYKQEGIQYIQEADKIQLPLDTQMQEVMEWDIIPQHCQWQRGCRTMAICDEVKIIQSKVHGNCVVINEYMFPLTDFLQGPLCKPTLEVQQRVAFVGMFQV